MTANEKALPLAGVRVLDLSRVLAGPMATMALGDLGAEIIKVEQPLRGDDTRDWGVKVGQTETAYFNSANRNKRSITLNLQSADGQRIARELAAQCDVVVQNFKVGGVERFGLDYATLSAANPRLIYCSISGYNSDGDEATRPGYDLVIQGETGLMGLNGELGQAPLKFGVAVVDMFTGMYSAQAILAALFERERSGHGRHVQMALFDCGLMVSSYYGLEALLRGANPPKYGNRHPSIVPYGVFDAADGPLVVTVGNNLQFQRFCTDVIERPDLATDERFMTNLLRGEHRDLLGPVLEAEIAARPRVLLLERLRQCGIPCGEVFGIHEALTSQRAVAGGLVTQQPHPDAGSTYVMAPPYRFDGERPPVRRPPPQLGGHTREVLEEMLGLDTAALQQLQQNGVV